MDGLSIQETWNPESICFGCGSANPQGLRIRSFADGDDVLCTWQPEGHHGAVVDVLNGGIVSTLLDCHSGAAVAWAIKKATSDWPDPATSPVTARLSIEFLRPTPVGKPLQLVARVVESQDDRFTIEARLESEGRVCATSNAVFVRLRPRPGS